MTILQTYNTCVIPSVLLSCKKRGPKFGTMYTNQDSKRSGVSAASKMDGSLWDALKIFVHESVLENNYRKNPSINLTCLWAIARAL